MIWAGDSKAHQGARRVHGDSDTVEKLDCTGHMGKRFHPALNRSRLKIKGKLSNGKAAGGQIGRM